MRKLRIALLGTFLAGVLLAGVGVGVAMVEYSSLQYGGEKFLGEDHLTKKVLEFQMPENGGTVLLGENQRYDLKRVTELVEDSQVAEGIVQYEITYNGALVEPYLQFDEYEQDEQEKQAGEYEQNEYAGSVRVVLDYQGDDVQLFLESKDKILDDLKEKRIASYRTIYVTEIVVKVNPETMPYVEDAFTLY